MDSKQLKEYLKTIIRQTVKEVLLEEKGIISHIIQECMSGMEGKMLVERIHLNKEEKEEQRKNILNDIKQDTRETRIQEKQQLLEESKKSLINSFGKHGYDNLKGIFEGIVPLSSAGKEGDGNRPKSPLANIDPNDPGIDLSIFNFKGEK